MTNPKLQVLEQDIATDTREGLENQPVSIALPSPQNNGFGKQPPLALFQKQAVMVALPKKTLLYLIKEFQKLGWGYKA